MVVDPTMERRDAEECNIAVKKESIEKVVSKVLVLQLRLNSEVHRHQEDEASLAEVPNFGKMCLSNH